ncbi:hypothetical protein RFI_32111, partial [Reticulomyxa filosa]
KPEAIPRNIIKELEHTFRKPKRGRILSANTVGESKDEMKITYEYGDSQKQEVVKFEDGDIVIAGDHIGFLRYTHMYICIYVCICMCMYVCMCSNLYIYICLCFAYDTIGRYVGELQKQHRPTENYYIGMECFEEIKGGHNGCIDNVEYFFTRMGKQTGVLVPFSHFKCKIPDICFIQFLFQCYLRSIAVLDQFYILFYICIYYILYIVYCILCVCVYENRAFELSRALLHQMKEMESLLPLSTAASASTLHSNSTSQHSVEGFERTPLLATHLYPIRFDRDSF